MPYLKYCVCGLLLIPLKNALLKSRLYAYNISPIIIIVIFLRRNFFSVFCLIVLFYF